jgi:hypothetical protein
MAAHDIDNISACNCHLFHLRLVHVYSFPLRASLNHGTFRFEVTVCKRMFNVGALDRLHPAVVRAVDCAGHSDSAPSGCDYEQITRRAAGYSDLVRCSDLSDEHNKYQVIHRCRGRIKNWKVSVQRIHTESVDSQNLHRQLELSRARELKLDADLVASERERERLIELVWTSRTNQQGWKESPPLPMSSMQRPR